MFANNLPLLLAIFIATSSLILLVAMLVAKPRDTVKDRLADALPGDDVSLARLQAASDDAQRALPRVGSMFLPEDESKLEKLKSRMQQAGLYRRHSTAVYLGVKIMLMVTPLVMGLMLFTAGFLSLTTSILLGVGAGLLGSCASSLWLANQKSNRQVAIRRALPDALDVIVVCLEGGLSLPAAFDRVATELKEAHPLLSTEMSIVRREVQLGRSTGDALRQFADRFDVEEVRSLASVVIQAERFGASIVKALRVHAEALRVKRYQHAEAQAQKAPVKLIFPTVLCIFPALYIILMGPAAVRLLEMLDKMGQK